MGNNSRIVQKIKRRNNDTFPTFIDSKEESLFIQDKPSKIDSFHGSMDILETTLNDVFKCTLSEIRLGMGKKQVALCETFIKRYSNSGVESGYYPKLTKKFFGEKLKPSAMFFESTDELFKRTVFMYQFSYAHYILGKYHKMKDSFPDWCCGYSSGNVVVALWEAGIASAVRVVNHSYDHSYIIVPFILDAPEMRGIIFIDPTSDQMFVARKDKVRNLVRIIIGEDWEYKTDWRNGANLFPEDVCSSASFGNEDKNYENYLRSAFQNPVVVV